MEDQHEPNEENGTDSEGIEIFIKYFDSLDEQAIRESEREYEIKNKMTPYKNGILAVAFLGYGITLAMSLVDSGDPELFGIGTSLLIIGFDLLGRIKVNASYEI